MPPSPLTEVPVVFLWKPVSHGEKQLGHSKNEFARVMIDKTMATPALGKRKQKPLP
jgi:hypothetical protein